MDCEYCQNTGLEWIPCYVCNGLGCHHCNELGESQVYCGCQYGQKLKGEFTWHTKKQKKEAF